MSLEKSVARLVGSLRSRPGVLRALLPALLLAVCAPGPARATLTFTPSGFIEETIASGLPFATGMAFAPDGRLFITQKNGQVRVWQNGTLLTAPFVDISAQVADSNDRGLLGVAVHPDFPHTPYIYLLFTWNPPGYSNLAIGGRVSRLIRVEADPAQGYNVALPGSEVPQTVVGGPGHVIILGKNSTAANIGNPSDGRDTTKASCMTGLSPTGTPIEDCIPSDEDSHSIGTVMFASDGTMFAGSGDGSNYSDVDRRALRSQNINSLAGKVVHIDPVTGNGVPSNPFYDAACPSCNRSKVYAYGLRNPFRFTLHPVTGEPYIGDVGWNSWEEINTGKGSNFGWPCYEGGAAGTPAPAESGTTTSLQQGSYAGNATTGPLCAPLYAQGLGAVKAPIFAYSHDGTDSAGGTGGASANGGTFYTGTTYPPAYQNALFILDYNRRWIRYLTFDAQGKATVHNFALESANGMVQILPGPDSNLYVVVLSVTGSQVRRIRYVGAGNTPPTAVVNATPTIGTVPLTVTFSSLGSFDPDNQPLSYSWTFGDGGTSTQQNPTHTYAAAGVYTATLTLTELTSPFASRAASVLITVGNEPPLATITSPPDGTIYKIGDIITYSGFGTSGGQPIDPSQLTWDVRLHHNEHMHFSSFPPGSGGTFQIIEHGDNTYYELCLTATVPPSLTDTRCVTLLPQLTTITLTTDPPGLFINYEDEGLTQASPMIIHTVVGGSQTASVQPVQGGLTFTGWADGEPSTSHPFIVGTTSVTYTAQYINQPPVALVQATPVTGNAPLTVVFDGSSSSDPELTTLVHAWDFGDGTTSTQVSPVHTYTAPGTYQAVLTVTDQRNGTASQPVTITVNTPPATCGNGTIDAGEQCDGGACCTSGCQFANAVTVCRGVAGACDVAETCSGTSATCPADVLRPSGFVCRASAGACDVAESCSGSSAACPANGFVANGTSCADTNLCNGAETCQAGACTAGTALVCNDNNICTDDTCNPATGCVFTNNTAPCSDGIACTADVCGGGTCTSTPACAPGETCNLVTGACDPPVGGFTIWPSSTVPTVIAAADIPVELGVKFTSDVAGYITGIRFYKDPRNTGTHVGNLWSSTGTKLATATFSNETASGWQQVSLSPPVAIAANTTYIASYFSPIGYYAISLNYFTSAGFDRAPLHALRSGVQGPNGVFIYNATSAFPNTSYADSNYWVDVAFSSAAPALQSIAVTPANPTATVGGTQQFTATGTYADSSTQNVTSQVTWASTSTGVATINAAGLATAAGAGTTTIRATLGSVNGSTTLTVNAPPALSITTTALPGGTQGQAYSATLVATGGTPPYTWSIASGALPAGVTLNASSGVISGTPTASGTFTITAQVTAGAQTATKALSIVVAGPPALSITTTALPGGTQGQAYSATLVATGGTPPYTWSIANGALPGGVTLNASSGVISGTPTASGTFTITAQVAAGAQSATKALSIVVAAPPAVSITTTALPGGTQGVAYSTTLAASGGTPPYTWSLASGTLPAGLALGASSGVISGTPTAAGTSSFTVQVAAGAQSATKALGIVVASPVSSTWPGTTVPPVIAGADDPVELGVKFRSDVSGYITGIRFYKDARNTGTHTGSLWTAGGTRLAQATFTGETGSGWQQVNFATPVAVTANTTYVASYFCPVGYYAISLFFFQSQGVDAPPLHLLSNTAAGGNGTFVYSPTSAFPNQVYGASNYWVDVVFSAVPPALQTIAVTPASPSVGVGSTQQFTATGTYADGSTQNLSGQVTWSSSTPAVATISGTGLATAVTTGSSTIGATLGAVGGSTSLTVTPPPPVSITTTALPGGTQGAAYTTTLAASGGTPPYTWSLASGTLPPGVTLAAGTGIISGTPTATGTSSFTVQVAAGAQTATKALSIVVAPAVTSLWSASTVPPVIAAGDLPVELGVKFRADVAGYIRGIRFYKDSRNTGTHVANLWSSTGTKLATATFTGETASGWQQVNFATPIAIAANTVYVASYFSPVGFYAIGLNYFATQGVDTPPLHAPANGVSGPNGVFIYNATSAFPNTSYAASNYWVDVIFSTTP